MEPEEIEHINEYFITNDLCYPSGILDNIHYKVWDDRHGRAYHEVYHINFDYLTPDYQVNTEIQCKETMSNFIEIANNFLTFSITYENLLFTFNNLALMKEDSKPTYLCKLKEINSKKREIFIDRL